MAIGLPVEGEPVHLLCMNRDETYCGITHEEINAAVSKKTGGSGVVADFGLTLEHEKCTCEECRVEYGLVLLANVGVQKPLKDELKDLQNHINRLKFDLEQDIYK